MKPRLEGWLVAALTLALVALYFAGRDAGPLQAIEGVALNQRFALRGPVTPSPEVAIVAVDERSLRELGRWPISRAVLAAAVRRIDEAGAAVIVFDLILTGRENGMADAALASAMARADDVVVAYGFDFLGQGAGAPAPEPIADSAYRVVLAGSAPDAVPTASAVLAPHDSFLTVARPAHASVLLDADGHLRFAHPALRHDGALYPSLAVEAVRLARGLPRNALAVELGRGLRLGGARFEAGADLAQPINYVGPTGSSPTFSLLDLVEGRVPDAALAGRVVLIGGRAAGLGDRFVTPYDANLPGVEVFANIVDNLLGERFLRRGAAVEALDLAALLLAGLAAAALAALRRTGAIVLGAAVLLAAWCAINLAAFVAGNLWLNFTLPALAVLGGAAIVIAGRGVRESRLRRALARYVSPFAADGGLVRGDRDELAAVMFCDLVGFTELGERLPPSETTAMLRGFHRRIESAVAAHGGVVDNYIGDAVLAVFGVPAGRGDAACQALACARAVAAAMAAWNAERRAAGEPEIACGVGLHFGPVRIAEVGGASHAQITVTGDTVNVASRLEGLTREFATAVIASDAVIAAARAAGQAPGDFAALPAQTIRGRTQPISLWGWRASA